MAGWLWDQMDNDVKNRNGEEPHLGQQSFFFFFAESKALGSSRVRNQSRAIAAT